ncbi:MAG: hypothetical protein N2651_06805 [Fimbriimonadales bacterium]|nr:hypothetical protein [Fimbriimonadales bacterium]
MMVRRWWILLSAVAALPWLPDICKAGRAVLWPVLWFSGIDPLLFGLIAGALELLIAALERRCNRREQQ